jgi:ribose-phosphate pyrophosphokinase
MSARAPMCLVACGDAADLASAVGRCLSMPVTPSKETWFACGEAKHALGDNVRGCDVYVFQRPVVPGSPRSVYDRTIAMLHAVDACRHADAARVNLVIPYFPGSRQDKRKGHVREGVTTSLFARMWMAAGVDMVITVDPHNEATVGAFDPSRCVFEAVSVDGPFSRYLEQQGLACDVVASTDVGGLERARHYAQRLGKPIAALAKERDYSRASAVTNTTVIGEVDGRSVLLVDDIVDTAGSMRAAVHALWERGATDMVIAGVHLLLSGTGRATLETLHQEAAARGRTLRVAGTSSVLHPDPPPWMSFFGLEPLLAQVISSVNTRGSVRALE